MLTYQLGGKCGAAYVDRCFQEFMEKRFDDAYKEVEHEQKMTGSKFMKAFEVNKRMFGGMEGEVLVNMPLWMNRDKIPDTVSTEQYHRRDGEVVLTK
jgi:hypothetical protein